jgi:hypothetical protein
MSGSGDFATSSSDDTKCWQALSGLKICLGASYCARGFPERNEEEHRKEIKEEGRSGGGGG